jgi:hypothetical protein
MAGQRPTVTGSQLLQSHRSVHSHGLIVADPLRKKQAFHTVDMPDAFDHQRPTLAADAAPVLVLDAGHSHHCTDPRLPSLVGKQRADQHLAVELVSFSAPAAP